MSGRIYSARTTNLCIWSDEKPGAERWSEYKIDITTKKALPSLALAIFRQNYYDEKKTPIGIPNDNADSFIRRLGGHADVYKPRGENFFYYDINSLYPMK